MRFKSSLKPNKQTIRDDSDFGFEKTLNIESLFFNTNYFLREKNL